MILAGTMAARVDLFLPSVFSAMMMRSPPVLAPRSLFLVPVCGAPSLQNAFGSSPVSLRTPLAEWRETIFPSTENVVFVIGLYQIS